ncbi:MAG: nucleotidyltransferase substrate binding protein [Patescibacteria group bacterium]
MNERIESFHQAIKRLEEALAESETSLNRDASIQRFEFTVELAWKSIQKFLAAQQIICQSPKSCFQEAFQFGLIEDDEKWILMMDDRNLTVHTYNQELAKEIYNRLSGYIPLLNALYVKLSS